MNAAQLTKQQKACHIVFRKLQQDGVISAQISIYLYARQITARRVESLKDLEDWELNALRDRLEGKPNKILEKIHALALGAGINNLESWMREVSKSQTFAFLRGHTSETLPMNFQWRLARCLERRVKPVSQPAAHALLF